MTRGRVDALDGLRALAVVLVVVFHLTDRLPGGWLGVDVFFVLSGWLITSLLVNEARADNRIDLLNFYLRRLLRLMPALVAMVVLAVAVEATVTPVASGFGLDVFAALTYWYDFHILGIDHTSPVAHTWSLAVEEQFYLLWPLLLIWATRARQGFVGPVAASLGVAVVAMAAGLAIDESTIGFALWGHAPELLIGALAAVLGQRWPSSTWVAVTAVAVLLSAAVLIDPQQRWPYYGPLLAVSALLASLVAHLGTRQSWVTAIFAWRPAVEVGRRSYGVYLYHYPLLFLLGNVDLPAHTTKVSVVVATLAVAWLSYRFLELPFLRLKDQLHGRRPAAVPAG